MPTIKDKKSKNKPLRVNVDLSSDSDESEHELSYYAKDKVKLMKEVLKLIKPKKIKSMAPDCIKNLDIVEINSMLLEELLGISNKRLQYIFNGENVDRETSSSESEEEKQPIDVISLDDISDDDDIEFCISEQEKSSLEKDTKTKKHEAYKIKTEPGVSVKLEKLKKETKKKSKKSDDLETPVEGLKENDKERLMSVLELLELQARARAIRSQLAIENENKKSETGQNASIKVEEESDSDVIIESPKNKEIVITSSDSENELSTREHIQQIDINAEPPQKRQKSIVDTESTSSEHLVKETKSAEVVSKQDKQLDVDSDKRKQKLMAKIQRVRLNRSKVNDTKNMSEDSAKCKDNAVEKSVIPTEISESCLVEDNITSEYKQLEDSSKMIENNDLINKEEEKEEIIDNDKIAINKEQETPSVKQTTKSSYCDNDEIVINLDEDEMDGIE